MEQNKEQYTKGFNQGYNLKKYHPNLYQRLMSAMHGENFYKESLADGAKQFEKEELQKQLKTKLDLQEKNEDSKMKR